MKQVEVTILGQGYVLGCPEGGESLLAQAVGDVDREMTTIRDAGRVRARERIAVLAALNIAYQLAERRAASRSSMPLENGVSTAVPGARPSGDDRAGLADTEGPDLAALIGRIDAALDSDGHLL